MCLTWLVHAQSIRAATARDADACVAIVAGLDDWFTEDVPDKVRSDLRDHGGWVIEDAGVVVGFVIAERSNIPLLTLRRARLTGMDRILKRLLDIMLAGLGLVVLWPIVAALIIWCTLKGHRSIWGREEVCTAGGRVATIVRAPVGSVYARPPRTATPCTSGFLPVYVTPSSSSTRAAAPPWYSACGPKLCR